MQTNSHVRERLNALYVVQSHMEEMYNLSISREGIKR